MPRYKVVLACDDPDDPMRPPLTVTGVVQASDSRDVYQQHCDAEGRNLTCPQRRMVSRVVSVRRVN